MYRNLIKKNTRQAVAAVTSLLFLVTAGQVYADVAVVANKAVSVDSITGNEAKKLWLGKSKSLGGASVKLADLVPGDPSRDQFYSTVVKKSEKKLKAYWAKIVFSGKGIPPKAFDSDAEVVDWVAKTPGAIGYVDSAAANDSVKVLMLVK